MSKKAPVRCAASFKETQKGSGDFSPTSRTEHRTGAPFFAFGVPKALLANQLVVFICYYTLYIVFNVFSI